MNRENSAFLLHIFSQESICLDHYDGVAGLEGDYDIEKIVLYAEPQPFHCCFSHGFRGIAVKISDTLSQRAVVQADADGSAVL